MPVNTRRFSLEAEKMFAGGHISLRRRIWRWHRGRLCCVRGHLGRSEPFSGLPTTSATTQSGECEACLNTSRSSHWLTALPMQAGHRRNPRPTKVRARREDDKQTLPRPAGRPLLQCGGYMTTTHYYLTSRNGLKRPGCRHVPPFRMQGPRVAYRSTYVPIANSAWSNGLSTCVATRAPT